MIPKTYSKKKKNMMASIISKAMKYYLLILLATSTSTIGASSLLSQGLTVKLNNTKISELFDAIEAKSNYKVLYMEKMKDKEVTAEYNNENVTTILNEVLPSIGLDYQINGNQIIITERKVLIETEKTTQDNRISISGRVIDQSGEPLIGVSVINAKKPGVGTSTDIEGKFNLIVEPNTTLRFSYIGFSTKELKASSTMEVILEEDIAGLEEVIVVGYGVQNKVTTTSSVSKVEGDDVAKMTVVNTSKALQGITTGITVVDRGGAPGSDDPDIFIRGVGTTGNSSPLILVDGIEMPLSQVPSSEIESISVLKDASSTSIYGSRAAHGVVLVTTKRGKTGKATISYNGYIGFQDLAARPKAVSAGEYMDMVNEASINAGNSPIYTQDIYDKVINGTHPYEYSYTNYVDEVYKSDYITEHTLNINGGSDAARYMVSFNYLDQPGLTRNTDFQRYNLRTNVDMNINKYLKASVDFSYRHIDRLWPEKLGDAQYRAFSMVPTRPIRYEDGSYTLDDQSTNPVAAMDLDVVGKNEYQNDGLVGQVKVDFEPIKDLTFTGVAALNGFWSRTKVHSKNFKFYDDKGNYVNQWNAQNGVKDERNNRHQLTLRFLANYKKTFGENHKINILYGMEQMSYRNYWSKAERKDLVSDNLPDVSLGSAGSQFAEGKPTKWGLNSFFGRINYSFKDRYLFEANLRSDGSSRFAEGHKWGTFPSFSAAWRISEEAFLEPIKNTVSNLKLRASWGQTGNNSIDEYIYLSQYVTEDVVMNGELVTGVKQNRMSNPYVTWETVELTDFGIDFGLLNNQIFGELDYYHKKTKDILLDLAIPKFIGLQAPPQNAGAVVNKGFEAMLGYRKINGDFKFSTSVNLSYNKNEWTDRGGDGKNIDGWTIQQIGSPLNAFYVYKANGLIANESELEAYKNSHKSDPRGMSELKAGDVKLVDINGDGTIDTNDRMSFNSNIPKFTFGINLSAEYKGFDLSLLFQGTSGANKFFYGEWYEGPSYEALTGLHFRERWTENNQNGNAKVPRLEAANNRNMSTYNSFYLKDVSYLRLKNAQLGYTIPSQITNKFLVSRLRVYFSGSNLFTISGLDQGLDPESRSGRPTAFPPLRIINFGVNIVF